MVKGNKMRTCDWDLICIKNYFSIGLIYKALYKVGLGVDVGVTSTAYLFNINILCFDLAFVIVRHAWREEYLFKAGSNITA